MQPPTDVRTRWWRLALAAALCGCEPAVNRLEVPGGLDAGPDAEPRTLGHQPAPALGGTLLLAGDLAVVSDADRNRILVVDLNADALKGTVALDGGARPWRAVEGAQGQVHVLLRGTGQVLHLAPAAVDFGGAGVVGTDDVCAEPRGLAADRERGELLVACRGGELVRLVPGVSGRTGRAADDVRDVLVLEDGGLALTTFRRASLQEGFRSRTPSLAASAQLRPEVAWRTVRMAGQTLMLHQLASTASVSLPAEAPPSQLAPYGPDAGRPGCSNAVVRAALTLFDERGEARTWLIPTSGATEVALAPGLERTCVLDRASGTFPCWQGTTAVVVGTGGAHVFQLSPQEGIAEVRCPTGPWPGEAPLMDALQPRLSVAGDYSGAAFRPDGTLVLHNRGLGLLEVWRDESRSPRGPANIPLLSGRARDDVDARWTRHFYTAPPFGAALSCNGCHPEGGEDGHVWRFDGLARRTKSLEGGLLGRGPYFWTGVHSGLAEVMEDSYVRRMGGSSPSPAEVERLGSWLDGLPAPSRRRLEGGLLAAGLSAFRKASCEVCHVGPQLTNRELADVGTGGRFRVPALVGLGARGPWMHDGCAVTLAQRFDAQCGGASHGNQARLTPEEFDALTAYLQSL